MKSGVETPDDVTQAVGSIVEAVIGQEMTDQEIEDLVHQVRTDDKTRSAVETITGAVGGGEPPRVKYSPATGKRYAPHMEVDPETGVRLEYVE